ncbi:MAG: GH3 auxin-responsive promoter family protein [Planctomycetota bacterium]|jgi:hypothetical protein
MLIPAMVIGLMTRGAAKRFERATRDPQRAQERLLLEMVRRNQDTDYGKRYGFASIQTVQDYQRQVPVVTYEDIREDMDRLVCGAHNVFTAEPPVMFSQTSGTTGNPKYIPLTPTCRGQTHKDVMKTWTYHATRAHRRIAGRKILSLVSPAVEGRTPAGIPFGSASGQIYRDMSPLIKSTYAIPYDVFEIKDYQAKYYTLMRIGVAADVGMICTANPSSVLKMCDKANEFAEQIIRDIHDGTLWTSLRIAPKIRRSVETWLRPAPDLAGRLEQARARRDGMLKPVDYWPNLAMIACWKGGTVGHYIEKFSDWFAPEGDMRVPIRDWGYLSSEARGSVPLSDEGSRGVLTVASNFLEFAAVEQVEANPDDSSSWDVLTVTDLVDGGEYYIFFTTAGGLCRYDINDVVQVEGMYNRTPQIIFKRKGRGMTNLTGEKVSVNQVIEAYERAAQDTGAVPAHFKAEADLTKSRYLFRVEFATPVAPAGQEAFLRALDKQLKEINIEYKSKRDSLRLGPPVLHVMREGWYEAGRKRWVDEGRRAFQAKTIVLSPVREQTVKVRPDLLNVVEMSD